MRLEYEPSSEPSRVLLANPLLLRDFVSNLFCGPYRGTSLIRNGARPASTWRPAPHSRRMTPATPQTLHPAPYTPHTTPHTLHPTLHPTPYTLHPTPCTRHPTPDTLHPTPYTRHPTPYTLHPTPYTLHTTPYMRERSQTLPAARGRQAALASELLPAGSTLNPEP